MFVYITVLFKYMKLLRNAVHNLSDNTHMRSKRYQEFYHDIVYHVRSKRYQEFYHDIVYITNE